MSTLSSCTIKAPLGHAVLTMEGSGSGGIVSLGFEGNSIVTIVDHDDLIDLYRKLGLLLDFVHACKECEKDTDPQPNQDQETVT